MGAAAQPWTAVRSDDLTIQQALRWGTHADTFRRLLLAINQSNVIVYIVRGECPGINDGCLTMAASGGGVRYFRMRVHAALTHVSLIAMIAHELAHLVELARAPDVVDEVSLRAFYERIGCPRDADHSYDTETAGLVGKEVACELRPLAVAERWPDVGISPGASRDAPITCARIHEALMKRGWYLQ
jgi:hypothetical protein